MVILLFAGGGLGNQMFQYAYARYIQIRFEDTLQLNIYGFKEDKRKYALGNFNIPTNVTIRNKKEEKWDFVKFKIKRKLLLIFNNKINTRELVLKLSKRGVYSQIGVHKFYEHNKDCTVNKKYVYGLYQSHKYFEKIREILKKELQVTLPILDKNIEYYSQIKESNSICVHIRRGDYLEKPWSDMLNVCTEEYYYKAMDVIAQKVENPVFYIFSNTSDDITWIKTNYKFNYPIVYVDNDNPDYEELRLMYSCKHFIISNSSYSWWAQYLGSADNKIVIAPNKWLNGDDYADVFMAEWTLIEV